MIGLGILCIAHWGLLYRTMFIVHAVWDDTVGACVVTQTQPSLLNLTFFFSKSNCCLIRCTVTRIIISAMGFDFVILCLTCAALVKKHTARTDLWKLLFQDGLIYFLLTFSMNCIPAVGTSILHVIPCCLSFTTQVLNVLNLNSE